MAATFALPSARGALVEPPSEPPSADAEEPEHDPASGPAMANARGRATDMKPVLVSE